MNVYGWIVEYNNIDGCMINSKPLKKHHSEFYWEINNRWKYCEDLRLTYQYLIKKSGFLIPNRTDWQLLDGDFDIISV